MSYSSYSSYLNTKLCFFSFFYASRSARFKNWFIRSHQKIRPLIPAHVKLQVKIVPLRFYVLTLHLPFQRPATRNPRPSSVRIFRNILVSLPNHNIFGRDAVIKLIPS